MAESNLDRSRREASDLIKRTEKKEHTHRDIDLSRIEHLFLGSTCDVSGKSLGTMETIEFLEKNKNPEIIYRELFTPVALINKKDSLEKINERRSLSEMRGMFTVLDYNQQRYLSVSRKLHPYIELNNAGEKGEIPNGWKVGLVGDDGKEGKFILLKVNPKFKKYFVLEGDLEGKGQMLKLRLGQGK